MPGDSFYAYYFSTTTGLTSGAAGSGVTWDFSSTLLTYSGNVSYLTSAGTPYTDSFPGCRLVVRYQVTGYGNSGYDYFATDSTGFYYQGYFRPGSGTGYFVWNRPSLLYYYPLSLGSTLDDSCLNYMYRAEMLCHYECDGYGTLILPGATHTNVLRIHRKTLDCPKCISKGEDNYIWLKPGFHHELLWANFDTTGGTYHMRSAYMYSASELPTLQTSQPKTVKKIYPNPATDQLNIELTTTEPCNYSIFTTAGTIIAHHEELTGKIAIDISTLPAGLYYVKLQSATESEVVRFVKE